VSCQLFHNVAGGQSPRVVTKNRPRNNSRVRPVLRPHLTHTTLPPTLSPCPQLRPSIAFDDSTTLLPQQHHSVSHARETSAPALGSNSAAPLAPSTRNEHLSHAITPLADDALYRTQHHPFATTPFVLPATCAAYPSHRLRLGWLGTAEH
jgi:hypothetical protein